MNARQRLLTLAGLLLPVCAAGCHRRAQVSRSAAPPPPPVVARSGTGVRRPVPPPVVVPNTHADDNTPNAGALHTVEVGLASWYAPSGRRSANGDVYDGESLTAAHRTLPLGTVLRVTNLTTGLSTTVTVTDRGPFVRGRILDLSTAAARATGVYRMGVAQVRMEVLTQGTHADLDGRWCVQVGAFADEDDATALKANLQRRYGAAARVIDFQGSTGWWVRLNPTSGGRATAVSIAASVRPAQPTAQAWLVRLD